MGGRGAAPLLGPDRARSRARRRPASTWCWCWPTRARASPRDPRAGLRALRDPRQEARHRPRPRRGAPLRGGPRRPPGARWTTPAPGARGARFRISLPLDARRQERPRRRIAACGRARCTAGLALVLGLVSRRLPQPRPRAASSRSRELETYWIVDTPAAGPELHRTRRALPAEERVRRSRCGSVQARAQLPGGRTRRRRWGSIQEQVSTWRQPARARQGHARDGALGGPLPVARRTPRTSCARPPSRTRASRSSSASAPRTGRCWPRPTSSGGSAPPACCRSTRPDRSAMSVRVSLPPPRRPAAGIASTRSGCRRCIGSAAEADVARGARRGAPRPRLRAGRRDRGAGGRGGPGAAACRARTCTRRCCARAT